MNLTAVSYATSLTIHALMILLLVLLMHFYRPQQEIMFSNVTLIGS